MLLIALVVVIVMLEVMTDDHGDRLSDSGHDQAIVRGWEAECRSP